MVTRIRRAVLMMALTLLMATCLAGVAWAVNTIHCPGEDSTNRDGYCEGTDRNDSCMARVRTRCMRGGERTPCTGAAGATHFTARRVRISHTVAPETTIWGATATPTNGAARTKSTAVPEMTLS